MKTTLALISLLIILSACAVNPVTGKNELSWISEAEQIRIGELQYGPSQQSQGGVYLADPEITQYVNEVGQAIAKFAPVDLPWEFIVLNNDTPNAWALPGGKIAINRGLLLALNNEAELAAVLSHEVVHAAAKHSAQSMQRNTITQGLLAATAIAVAHTDYKEYANYVVGGAQLGVQLISTKYGRSAELESDYYGIQYMNKAGYNPEAAVSLQETFVRLSSNKKSNWLSGLFASHPPSVERVNTNKATIAALESTKATELFAQRYRSKMTHLLNTKPAYEYANKARTLASDGEYESALKALNKAIQLEPQESSFHGERGSIYFQTKQYGKADQAFSSALALNDNCFEYYLGRGLARNQQGKHQAARQDLERSIALLPTASANKNLGEMALAGGDRSSAKRFFQLAMGAQGPLGDYAKLAYLKLDIQDHPTHYISVELRPSPKGQILIVVTNRASLDIMSLKLEVNALVGQQKVSRTLGIQKLYAKTAKQYASAWYISESTEAQIQGINISAVKLN
ncbi:MAG: M48 family metalloprotease [Pseudomonadales bacterium]|nr:M48 family metalloprotease [Pseudomonadales bacterium]